MRRSEIRKIERRKARRKAREPHGHPQGRRMICPECSKIYAAKEKGETA